LFSPLEQFEVFPIFDVFFKNILLPESFDVAFTNFSLFVLFSLVVFVYWAYAALQFSYVIPTRLQLVFENLYRFLYSVLTQQAGLRGGIFFPFLAVTFITIFFSKFSRSYSVFFHNN